MTQVYEVFTPGKTTNLTFVDRQHESVADELTTLLNRGGKFISVVGPTKMGKTVLVERLSDDALFLQGQSITDTSEMWRRIGAFFQVSVNQTSGLVDSVSLRTGFWAKIGFAGSGAGADASTESVNGSTETETFEQFPDQALPPLIKEAREANKRITIVLDDFHFIEEAVRKQVIQALKPLAHAGASVVLITLPHRRAEASRLVRDVGGRTTTLEVSPWSHEDLGEIGSKGFAELNLLDPHDVATRISEAAFGSPQIAQQLLLELCERENGIQARQAEPTDLQQPDDWATFCRLVQDDDSNDWVEKLDSGPKSRGTKRKMHRLKNGAELDGYGVILAALRSCVPPLSISLNDLNKEIAAQLGPKSKVSDIGVSTKLGHMTAIAAKSLEADALDVDEDQAVESDLDPAAGSPQPVFEFVAEKDTVHILEPYLAFTLAWHTDYLFEPGN